MIENIPDNGFELGHSCASISRYPAAASIMAQPVGAVASWVGFEREAKNKGKLMAAIAKFFADLKRDLARYEDIRLRGAKALSDYDRNMQGDEGAVRTALALKFNHVKYSRWHLDYALRTWPELYAMAESGEGRSCDETQVDRDRCEECDEDSALGDETDGEQGAQLSLF
jgi:hypothetical protein